VIFVFGSGKVKSVWVLRDERNYGKLQVLRSLYRGSGSWKGEAMRNLLVSMRRQITGKCLLTSRARSGSGDSPPSKAAKDSAGYLTDVEEFSVFRVMRSFA